MTESVITPTGVALYPWLTKPDTKYSEEGVYSVNLVLSKEDAKPLIKTINEVFEEYLKDEMKKQKKKDLKTANPPYSEQLDDNGKPTGNLIFKFKLLKVPKVQVVLVLIKLLDMILKMGLKKHLLMNLQR